MHYLTSKHLHPVLTLCLFPQAVVQQLLQPGHEVLVPLTPGDELPLTQHPVPVSVALPGTKRF